MESDDDLKMIVGFLCQQMDQIKERKQKVAFLEQCVTNLVKNFKQRSSLNFYIEQLIQKLEIEYGVAKKQNSDKVGSDKQQDQQKESGKEQQVKNNYDNLLNSVIKNSSRCRSAGNEEQDDLKNYKRIMQALIKSGEHFIDPEFRHCLDSISDEKESQEKYKQYNNWLRVKDILRSRKNNEVYLFNEFSTMSVKQGYLGNCYILASLSAIMVAYPEYIFRLFQSNLNSNYCEYGIYTVKLSVDGKWKNVIVDDYFPCDRNRQPIFAKPYKNEVWVMLLEKAIAKTFKTYCNLERGHSQFAMNLLTGAPSSLVVFREYVKDMNQLFKVINEYYQKKYLITTSTGNNDGVDQNQLVQSHIMGFQKRHAYTVIDVYQEGSQKRIKLRNPWGDGKKVGDGSKQMDWSGCQIEVQRRQCQDSEVWIDFQQFIAVFDNCDVNKLSQNYYEKYMRIRNILVNDVKYIEMTLKQDTNIFISLFQQNSRLVDNFEGYWRIYLKLYKYDGQYGDWIVIDSISRASHVVTIESSYCKGRYLIEVCYRASGQMVDWNSKQIMPYLTLNFYSSASLGLDHQFDRASNGFCEERIYEKIGQYYMMKQSEYSFRNKYPIRMMESRIGKCLFVYVIQNIHNCDIRVQFMVENVKNVGMVWPKGQRWSEKGVFGELEIKSGDCGAVVLMVDSDKGDYSYSYNYQISIVK